MATTKTALQLIKQLRSTPFKVKKSSHFHEDWSGDVCYIYEVNEQGEVSVCSIPNWDGDDEDDANPMAWLDPRDLIIAKTK